ncbi:UNVERIFIED_CONTAM: hypothetical protein PYX00_010966 [Menopon gallinae]|uniref:Uncharacterized protein n=1 Tax=Menopon gallinae TaxID=328185 RepID=A0AAW2H6T5_9NEOP
MLSLPADRHKALFLRDGPKMPLSDMSFQTYKMGMYVDSEVRDIIKDITALDKELKKKKKVLNKVITKLKMDEDMLDTILNTGDQPRTQHE